MCLQIQFSIRKIAHIHCEENIPLYWVYSVGFISAIALCDRSLNLPGYFLYSFLQKVMALQQIYQMGWLGRVPTSKHKWLCRIRILVSWDPNSDMVFGARRMNRCWNGSEIQPSLGTFYFQQTDKIWRKVVPSGLFMCSFNDMNRLEFRRFRFGS